MFFNISNHPSYTWGQKQTEVAKEYGDVIDIQFPNVNPSVGIDEICKLAQQVCNQVAVLLGTRTEPSAAMIQGEYTTVYQILKRLNPAIKTFAATSTRNVDNKFEFVGLRPYEEE